MSDERRRPDWSFFDSSPSSGGRSPFGPPMPTGFPEMPGGGSGLEAMRYMQAARDEFLQRFMHAMWYSAQEAARVAREARDMCVGLAPGATPMSEAELSDLRQKLAGLDPAVAAEVMQSVQMSRARGFAAAAPRPPSKVDVEKVQDALKQAKLADDQIDRVVHAVNLVDAWEADRRAKFQKPND